MKTYTVVVMLGALSCSLWAAAQAPVDAPENKAKAMAKAEGKLWSANESIGTDVVGANGEDLGEVEDIVLDRDMNRIAYVIVTYGGLLGLGNKLFAVPWQAFGQNADGELTLQIDPERLKDAPGFEKGTLPNTADPLFHEGVYSFYKAKPYALDRGDKDDTKAQGQAAPIPDQTSDTSFDWPSWTSRGNDSSWARRLGELLGTNIENAQGESIAELEDIIVDTREARAAYAVVSFGGTLGLFADTAIIPWNALRLDLGREAYVTDATLAQLERAKLSDSEYQQLEDRKNSEALYSTFGTQPFWEEFGYVTEVEPAKKPEKQPMKEEVQKTPAKEAPSKDMNDRNTVSGMVVSLSGYTGATPETSSQRGVRVRVRMDDGTVRTVHLATNEELQRQGLTLNRGDQVVITGELQDYHGHNVLVGREVQKGGKTYTFEMP